MGLDLRIFGDEKLDELFLEWLVDHQAGENIRRYGRLWEYYSNPMTETALEGECDSARGYRQAQEMGLPARITGAIPCGNFEQVGLRRAPQIQRKEVVIENDIAWRINAMVDFLFGKGVKLVSPSPEPSKRRTLERILTAVISGNGGVGFFQELAVLGSVYGFVDCIIRPGEEWVMQSRPSISTQSEGNAEAIEAAVKKASQIALELIEAPRALPVLDENDYRRVRYFVQHFRQAKNAVAPGGGWLSRLVGGAAGDRRQAAVITEILGPTAWQRYEDGELIAEGENPLGAVPVVHIQNLAQPYRYEGLSDVELLIGLQDELNTRLSDRASRITFQSFKMYLVKGLNGAYDRPVAPGRMWCTDNAEAKIEAFGGDDGSPSEEQHVEQIREAMDKVSGVTPVVAGLLKNKIGNLTSGVALKMTYMGMLAKTLRKQRSYGEGIRAILRTALELLDRYGIFPTTPEERQIEVVFPSPLPEDTTERLQEAKTKLELGVAPETVLNELGY